MSKLDVKKRNELIWEFKAPISTKYNIRKILVKDNTVIVGCKDEKSDKSGYPAYALNLRTGKEIWEFKIKLKIKKFMVETRPIAMKDNIVLLACVGRFFSDIGHIETSYRIYAIKNGRKLWEFDAEGGITSMSIKYGIVIVGCQSEGWIYVLNLNTGEKIWELKIENDARVLIVDDMAVVSCYDGYIYALDLKEEKRMWEFKAESRVYSITTKDNIVIVGCSYNEDLGYAPVYALNLKTGKLIWKFKANYSVSNISINNDFLILSTEDLSSMESYVYALNLHTANKIWEFKAESTVFTILSEDNIVVVACRKFNNNYASLYILDLETGKIIWEFKEEEHIVTIAIKDTILLVGCKGKVYAFDLNKII